MGLIDSLSGAHVALDTNALVYHMEDGDRLGHAVRPLFEAADDGSVYLMASTLLLTEILHKPIAQNDEQLIEAYLDALGSAEDIDLVDVAGPIAIKAARLSGTHSLTTVDAVHLATAVMSGATDFVTNDRRMSRIGHVAGVRIHRIVDHVAA